MDNKIMQNETLPSISTEVVRGVWLEGGVRMVVIVRMAHMCIAIKNSRN